MRDVPPRARAVPATAVKPRERPSPRRRTFRPRRWAFLLLLAAVLAVAANLLLPAGPFPPRETKTLVIERGQTLKSVATELKRVGLIRGTLSFLVLARVMGLDRTIKAGQYEFKLGTTIPGLLRLLVRGMHGLNLVTIPEGLTIDEVIPRLAAHLEMPEASFDSLVADTSFLRTLGVTAPSIEGYLAPDTYEFLPGTAPAVAFRTMVRRMQVLLLEAAAGVDSLPLGMSLDQVLILASIVESEAQVDDERPRIARVYLSRLERGMRLQADPTVAFATGRRPRSRVTYAMLKVDSPYNTYRYEGLPPGPICNPGLKSIQAVIFAGPDQGELYFVARGQGRHWFAHSYAGHLANIRQVRAMMAEPDTLTAALDSASVSPPAQ